MQQQAFGRYELPDVPGFVGLAEVIRQVRGELEEAREEAQGRALGFTVENVNLTFMVQVHRSGTGRGGVRIGVVTAELGGTVDRQTTHQVQVDLKPDVGGERVRVGRGGTPRTSEPDGGTPHRPANDER